MIYIRFFAFSIVLLFSLNSFAQVKITPGMESVPPYFKGHDPEKLAEGLSKIPKSKLKDIGSTKIYGDLTGSDLFAFSPLSKTVKEGRLGAQKHRYTVNLYPLFDTRTMPEPLFMYVPGAGVGGGIGNGDGRRLYYDDYDVIDKIVPLYHGAPNDFWRTSYLTLKREYGTGAMDKSYTNSKLARKVYYIPSPQINYGLAFTKNPGLPLLDSREEYFDLGKYDEVPRRLPAIGAWTDNGESYRDGRPLFIVRLAAPYFKSEKMSAMNPVEKQPHVVTRNLFYVEIVGIWMIDGYTGKVISKTGAMPDVKWSAAPKSPETKPSAPRSITEVQITSMPKPVKPEGCAFEVKGTVSLRVTFQADGKIGSIAVVSGLPCGFSEAAIKAAREIKFTPQMNDGVPVAITKTIQYSF